MYICTIGKKVVIIAALHKNVRLAVYEYAKGITHLPFTSITSDSFGAIIDDPIFSIIPPRIRISPSSVVPVSTSIIVALSMKTYSSTAHAVRFKQSKKK